MKPGTATLMLERDNTTLVVKDVPADVCDQCSHELFSLDVADQARGILNGAVERGVQVEVLSFTREQDLQPAA